MGKSKRPRLRRDVAMFVRVFVHIERVNIPAVHPELINKVRDLGVGRPGVRHDEHNLASRLAGLLNPVKHIGDPEKLEVGIGNDLDAKIGIRVSGDVPALDATDPLDGFRVAKGNAGGGAELKFFHDFSLRVKTHFPPIQVLTAWSPSSHSTKSASAPTVIRPLL